MKIKPTDFLSMFSEELYIVNGNDGYNYVISQYHLGDPSCDYGIFAQFKKFDSDCVPDMYVSELYEFLMNDYLVGECNIEPEIVDELSQADWVDYPQILKKHGKDPNTANLEELANGFMNNFDDETFELATADELKQIRLFKKDY